MLRLNYRKLGLRIVTIVIYAPIIVMCVYLGSLPFFIMVLVIAFLGLQEMYQMYQLKTRKVNDQFYFGYVFSALLLLSVYMREVRYVWENYLFIVVTLFAVAFFIYELFCKKVFLNHNPFIYLARSIIYIGVMSSFSILLRDQPHGLEYCLYLVGVVWASDTFAYLIGIPLGRHKLYPQVSPKKSVEGALGGILGAVSISLIMRWFFSMHFLLKMTIFEAVMLGIAVSIFAQLGDLVESLLKRDLAVKDSGDILPGHGGILDRLDSFILVFPVFYYFIYYFVR